MTLGRRVGLVLGALLGVLLLLVLGAYAALQSEAGRAWAARQISAALTTPGETAVTLEGLTGPLPQSIGLERVTVSDAEGSWLAVTNLQLDWRPLALFGGRLEITSLTVEGLTLERLPDSPAETKSESDSDVLKEALRFPLRPHLGHFAIKRIEIGEAAFGQAASLTLTGGLTTTTDQAVQTRFDLSRLDDEGSQASLQADYDPQQDTLSVDLSVTEPADGLLSEILGDPSFPGLDLSLKGDGSLANWTGRLSLDLPALVSLDGDLGLQQSKSSLAFSLKGKAQVQEVSQALPWPLLAGTQDFDLAGQLRDGQVAVIDRLSIDGPAGKVQASGQLDLGRDQLKAEATVGLTDQAAGQATGYDAQGVNLTLKAEGAFAAPALVLSARAGRFNGDGLAAQDLSLQAKLTPESSSSSNLSVQAKVESLLVAGAEDLKGFLGERFEATLEGALDLEAELLTARQLSLTSAGPKITGQGRLDLGSGDGRFDLNVVLADLKRLDSLIGLGLTGRGDIDLPLSVTNYGAGLKAPLTAKLSGVGFEVEILQALLQGDVDLSTELALDGSGLTLSDLAISSQSAKAKGRVALSENYERLAVDYDLTLPDLASLSPALGVALAGPGQSKGQLAGPLDDLVVEGLLEVPQGQLEGIDFGAVSADYRVWGLTRDIHGKVTLRAEPATGAMAGDLTFVVEPETFRLSQVSAESNGSKVTGTLAVPLSGGAMTGKFAGKLETLAPWLQLADLEGSGGGSLTVDLAPSDQGQGLSAEVDLSKVAVTLDQATAITAESLTLKAKAPDIFEDLKGSLSAQARNLTADNIVFKELALETDAALAEDSLTLNGSGSWRVPGQTDSQTTSRYQVTYPLSGERLGLDLTLSEPSGGLISEILGDPAFPGMTLGLKGDGALTDWAGKLSLALPKLVSLDSDLSLTQGEQGMALTLKGKAQVEEVSKALPWPLIAGSQDIDLAGSWKDGQIAVIERFTVTGPAGQAKASGEINLAQNQVQAEAALTLTDQAAGQATGYDAKAVSLSLKAAGSLSAPEVTLRAQAERFAGDGLTAQGLDLQANLTPNRSSASSLTAKAMVASLVIKGAEDLKGFLGERFEVSLDGTLDLEAETLRADKISLKSDGPEITGKGNLDLGSGKGQFDLALVLADLKRLDSLVGLGLAGRGDITLPLTVTDYGAGLKAPLSAKLKNVTFEQEVLAALLQGDLDLSTVFALDGTGLTLSDLKLSSQAASVTGDMALTEGFDQLALDYAVSLPDLAPLSPALSVDLAGSGRTTGKLSGTLDSLVLEGLLEVPKGRLEGFELGAVSADYRVWDLTSDIQGQVALRAEPVTGPLSSDLAFLVEPETFHLSKATLASKGSLITGNLSVPLDGGAMTGRFSGEVEHLAPWLKLAALDGDGGGSATVRLTPLDQGQGLEATADLTKVAFALDTDTVITAESLSLRVNTPNVFDALRGSLSLEASTVSAGEASLKDIVAKVDGKETQASFSLETQGTWQGDFDLSAAGSVSQNDDVLGLTLSKLQGRLLGQDLRLRQAATLSYSAQERSIQGLSLDLGDGTLTAEGRLDETAVQAQAKLDKFSLDVLAALVPGLPKGIVNGDLSLSGPLSDPRGQANFLVEDLHVAVSQSQNFTLKVDSTLDQNRLSLIGNLSGRIERSATFTAVLPLRIEPQTLAVIVPQDEAVSGRLDWHGDLDAAWELLPLPDHELSGNGRVALSLGGTLAEPTLTGDITLNKARYENITAGTVLTAIDAQIDLDGRKLTIKTLTARDGGKGRLSASGGVTINRDKGFPFAIEATMKQAKLVRRDDVVATLTGTAEIKGDISGAKLVSKLKTDRVEIMAGNQLPPSVISLDVIEINSDLPDEEIAAETKAHEDPFRLDLDVTVKMDRRVFVRNGQIDSEWSGNLHVTGTASNPIIAGKISLVRGQITVAGLSFRLTRGEITFTGGTSLDPLLDIEATSSARDIEVKVLVTGTAEKPEIELTSVPVVPQDEILSRLLFDKGAGELTAGEGVQLAAALAELANPGRGAGGLLGSMRRGLGVDVLRFDTATNGDTTTPAISVGKYLTDNVYVGVTQGTAADTGSVGVEVDLTPNISVESDLKESGDSNIGIRFHWDY